MAFGTFMPRFYQPDLSGEPDSPFRFSMRNDLAHERYIVEVDGIAKAECPIFVCALKSQLTAKARASELPHQIARRWRRDCALTYMVAKGRDGQAMFRY
jgi:hypothetical protein